MKNTPNVPLNVLRHNNHWERAPRDPISAAIAVAVTGATTGIAYYAVYALSTLVISMVTSAVLGALAPKPDFGSPSSNSGQLLSNGKNALAPAQFVYGQVRKGGTVTYIESTGDTNKILHQIIVLAAHEVEEIGDHAK